MRELSRCWRRPRRRSNKRALGRQSGCVRCILPSYDHSLQKQQYMHRVQQQSSFANLCVGLILAWQSASADSCYRLLLQVFIDQLADMSKAVKEAKTAQNSKHKAAVATGFASYSYAMSNQRSAAPTFAAFGPISAAAQAQGPMFGAAAGLQLQSAAPGGGGMPAPAPVAMQFMSSTSAMRQKMSSNAADYVSKKAKK